MNIAVTGGGGTIGRALVRHLREGGHAVVGSSGPPGAPEVAGLRVIDLSDEAGLGEVFAGSEVVIHLAAQSRPALSWLDPAATHRANVDGTAAVCRAARAAGVSRLVFASTAERYAGGRCAEGGPFADTSPYAASKAEGERIVAASGLAYAIARLFLIVDPLAPTGVIAQICAHVRAPAVPLAAPDVVRDLVHVDDAAAMLAALATGPLPEGGAVNLGSGVGTRLGDLAAACHRIAGGAGVVRLEAPDRPGTPLPLLVADLTRARALGLPDARPPDAWLGALVAHALHLPTGPSLEPR